MRRLVNIFLVGSLLSCGSSPRQPASGRETSPANATGTSPSRPRTWLGTGDDVLSRLQGRWFLVRYQAPFPILGEMGQLPTAFMMSNWTIEGSMLAVEGTTVGALRITNSGELRLIGESWVTGDVRGVDGSRFVVTAETGVVLTYERVGEATICAANGLTVLERRASCAGVTEIIMPATPKAPARISPSAP